MKITRLIHTLYPYHQAPDWIPSTLEPTDFIALLCRHLLEPTISETHVTCLFSVEYHIFLSVLVYNTKCISIKSLYVCISVLLLLCNVLSLQLLYCLYLCWNVMIMYYWSLFIWYHAPLPTQNFTRCVINKVLLTLT